MSYVDIVICIGSLPVLETWPPIYRGQERMVRDILKVSQSSPYVYFRYTPCLTNFTFDFIRRPISSILSPSSRTFIELTLVNFPPRHVSHMLHILRSTVNIHNPMRAGIGVAAPANRPAQLLLHLLPPRHWPVLLPFLWLWEAQFSLKLKVSPSN
jgi:hypothetical protein